MSSLFTSQRFMEEPFVEIEKLREQGPLVKVHLPIIGKVWITTTQQAAGAVLKDQQHFSMRKSDGKVTGMQWWMPRSIGLLANNMLTMDEPDHTRLRHLVDKAFRRDFVMSLEPRVQKTADNLAKNIAADSNSHDLVTEFARPLPLAVICEMLGIDDKDRTYFAKWAESLTTVNGIFGFIKAIRPINKMTNYLSAEIERQRHDPGSGLIGQLVTMQKEGEEISDDEMVAMFFLLLVAGHETTTHVISGGVFELLRNQEKWQWLLEDEDRIAMAVEELLRFVSAVQFTKPRNARSDVVVDGVKLKKGDVVMVMIAAANSDKEVISCPHDFDLSRKPNRHLAFGGGPHFCLGHQLARMEIACALKALIKHCPDLKLAVPEAQINWRSRVGLRALEKLPVISV